MNVDILMLIIKLRSCLELTCDSTGLLAQTLSQNKTHDARWSLLFKQETQLKSIY